jgi:hypothetical protein
MAHLEIDEYLEMLYHLRERHQVDLKTLKEHQPDFEERVLNDLQTQGLLKIDGEKMQLTEVGFQRAERIVRRHRLAETDRKYKWGFGRQTKYRGEMGGGLATSCMGDLLRKGVLRVSGGNDAELSDELGARIASQSEV